MSNYLEKEFFDEERLALAARQVSESLLVSLPSSAACDHIFSESFCQKMDKLILRERFRRARKKVLRSAAAIILAIFIAGSAWLAVDVEARTASFSWIKETYETYFLYRYFGEISASVLPRYELTAMQEGFEEIDRTSTNNAVNVTY